MRKNKVVQIDPSYSISTNIRNISESNDSIEWIDTYSELTEWFDEKEGKSLFIFEESGTIRPQDEFDSDRSKEFWRLAAKANEYGLPMIDICEFTNIGVSSVSREIHKVRSNDL